MTRSDIIDNQNTELGKEINDRLEGSKSVKFAVGYLYLSGFYQIADKLEDLQEAKILVGNHLSQNTIEKLAQKIPNEEDLRENLQNNSYERPSDKQNKVSEISEGIRSNIQSLPHSVRKEAKIAKLAQLIAEERIKIKVYTKHPLHAKAYLFRFKDSAKQASGTDGVGIIGSSNLTLSGFSRNTELNTYVRGPANYDELNSWFNQLWEDAVPFEDTLIENMEESWALKTVNPHDIYILTLYHLVQSSIEESTEQIWFWSNESFMDRIRSHFESFTDLYTFQKAAIRQAVNTINRYNGVFISDVVGLGKTFIGAGILKQLGKRSLIISPARLKNMWEEFVESFEIDAQVISQGMLYHGEYDSESVLDQFQNRQVALIDESHHFRNSNTKKYKELQPYLTDKKVVLLTATPQNTSVWNIYNQIKLFHQTEENIFPVKGAKLRSLFKEAENGNFKLQELLKYVLIRRTRTHVKKYYQEEDDIELVFPERDLETLTYNIDEIYEDLYSQILMLLEKLNYARYDLWRYVKPEKSREQPYLNLRKLIGTLPIFYKIRLFQRLESSIAAFRQSIDNYLSTHRRFYQIINERDIIPAGDEIQDRIYRYDYEKLSEYLEGYEPNSKYDIKDFEVENLLEDLESDIAIFKRIKNYLSAIPEDKDPKFDKLVNVIKRLQGSDQKVLIFSQFTDTVEYLERRLQDNFDRVDFATGNTNNLGKKIGAFAPKANSYEGKKEINILVGTDVLSEGHNLQDCNQVINYDLHWNPVKLIQRAGRVDRIGSEANFIHILNFLPVERVEKEISLREKLENRINEIHEYIGEDQRILDPDERLNKDAMYAIYARNDIDDYEESEDVGFSFDEAESIVRNLKEEKPEYFGLIEKMQLGLRSIKTSENLRGTYAFFRKGDFPKVFIKKEDGRIIEDFSEVISEIKCEAGTPEIQVSEGAKQSYYSDLSILKNHFQTLLEKEGERTRIHAQVRKTKQRLQRISQNRDDEDFLISVNKLDQVLNEFFPRQYISKLKKINQAELGDDEFFNRLIEMYNEYEWEEFEDREQELTSKGSSIQFICGEILT